MSITQPNSFWGDVWVTLVLLNTDGGNIFFCFETKMVSWVFYPAGIYLLKVKQQKH